MDPGAILERFLERPRVALVRAVLDIYGQAAGGLLANGLAFAALFATIPDRPGDPRPGRLAASTSPDVQAELADALASVFPPLTDLIDGALDGLVERRGPDLAHRRRRPHLDRQPVLRDARRRVRADLLAEPERDIVRRTARGFVWVALLIGIVVVLIVLVGLSSVADAWLPDTMPAGRTLSRVLTSPPVVLAVASGS